MKFKLNAIEIIRKKTMFTDTENALNSKCTNKWNVSSYTSMNTRNCKKCTHSSSHIGHSSNRYRCEHISNTYLLVFTLFLVYVSQTSDACSCIYSHPQEHYCSAEFVALINVRRVAKNDQRVVSYVVKVKKEFKMTVKAREALSKGLIWTSSDESSCGRQFESNTRYLITGRIIGEKPWVSVCNYVEKWTSLTYKQRKGFRRLYSLGCRCKVREPPSQSYYSYRYTQNGNETSNIGGSQTQLAARPGYCHWETRWANQYDCQALHSMCTPVTPVYASHNKVKSTQQMKQSKQHQQHIKMKKSKKKKASASMLLHECRWTISPVYRECMQTREEKRNSANSNSNWDEP